MQPQYQNKSFEELRVEDYMQNRKLPQSGSFGGTTGGSTFGGFGQTNAAAAPATGGGLFGGGNTNTAGGFGATNTATTGFGANANNNTSTGFGANNTGGGLFGAAKPATGGGLFGNNAASSGTATGGFGATSGSGGGLFGNTQPQANTGSAFGGGFGAGAANTNTTGGGLFGAQNNATQAKPAFGGFGATNTASTGTGAFGQANNAQQPQQSGGLFGGGNTANAGSSLFGGQQNKPAGGGLFGASTTAATNTGGGLFGNTNNNNQQQQGTGFGQSTNNTGGGLFGANNNNQTNNAGGGLFGNSQAKPATGGLFGASTTGTNTTGGLFGNNNQQQQQGANAGGSLFGNNNNQQQNAGGSLFGGQQNKPAGGGLFGGSTGGGGSLFGNSQAQNQGGLFGGSNANQGGGNSLFGGNNQSQNQGAGSSLFGGSQQQQQQNQLTATLTGDPYGNAQLFSSLAAPSPPVGPLATPLNGAKAPQRPRTSLLSSVRGGTPMLGASQNMTPRTRPGYGFSYSTYNSPASGAQNLTPGAAGLLRPTGSLGSSLSGRLSKSFSTSNLRGEAPEGHSLLRTPAAGQPSLLLGNGNGSIGSGSARKLKIDRNLRTDLFGDNTPKQKQLEVTKEQDPTLRKRVSFDRSAEDNTTAKPSASNSLVVREDEDITPTGSPEPKQVNGNALDSVPEESTTPKAAVAASPRSKKVVEGGEYWTSPSLKQLQGMSRQQLQNIGTFTVGRHNMGQVEFGRDGGVDLSTVPLERICGDLVLLEYRHCTVYGEDQEKPPVGEGLNVPSTIHLEQSWPRSSRASSATPQGQAAAAKSIEKHRRGLSNVKDTDFVDYDANTGIWTFNVEHFTTYGFDESDDEADFEDGTDMMDLQPKIPTSMRNPSEGHLDTAKTQRSEESDDSDMDSPDLGEPEDTFEFKLSRRSHQGDLNVPGGFDDVDSKSRSTFEHDEARTNTMHQDEHIMSGGLGNSYMDDPFIEAGGAVQAPNSGAIQGYHSSSVMEDDDESDQEVPGSYRAEPLPPRSILKPSAHMRAFASPEKVAELPWEEQLQRTMSPKKRDRQALRDMQGSLARAPLNGEATESPLKKALFSRSQLGQSHLAVKSAKKNATGFGASTLGGDQDLGKSQAFTTGMDLINSLWGQTPKETKATDATAEV
jgi:nuclear pore complex protein Nup98-Nup96